MLGTFVSAQSQVFYNEFLFLNKRKLLMDSTFTIFGQVHKFIQNVLQTTRSHFSPVAHFTGKAGIFSLILNEMLEIPKRYTINLAHIQIFADLEEVWGNLFIDNGPKWNFRGQSPRHVMKREVDIIPQWTENLTFRN